MGKYSTYATRQSAKERPWEVHPIWRGIGCLFMIIIPMIAFAGSHLLVNMNLRRGWFPVPPEVMDPLYVPVINYSITHFYATLAGMVVLTLLGFAALMAVYTIIYSLMAPSRYGPTDSPPVRRHPRSQKRR